jgi:hypothetical protein
MSTTINHRVGEPADAAPLFINILNMDGVEAFIDGATR